MNQLLCILLIHCIRAVTSREEWIDPYDMNTNMKQKIKWSTNEHNLNYDTNSCSEHNSSHLKRIINLILKTASFDRSDPNNYIGILNIHLPKKDYDFLESFANGDEVDNGLLRRLNSVLDKSLSKSTLEQYGTYFFTMGDRVYYMICSPVTGFFICIIIILYFTWRLEVFFSYKRFFMTVLMFLWIADFCLKYQQLLEVEEIDRFINIKTTDPDKCDPKKRSLAFRIYNFFTGGCNNEDYKTYLISTKTSAIYFITPLKVFSQQSEYLVYPLQALGEGVGHFINAMLDKSPWYMKAFVLVAAVLFVSLLFILTFSWITGTTLRVSLFQMFKFDIRHNTGSNNETTHSNHDRISGDNLRLLLEQGNQLRQIHGQRSEVIEDIGHQRKPSLQNKILDSSPNVKAAIQKEDLVESEKDTSQKENVESEQMTKKLNELENNFDNESVEKNDPATSFEFVESIGNST